MRKTLLASAALVGFASLFATAHAQAPTTGRTGTLSQAGPATAQGPDNPTGAAAQGPTTAAGLQAATAPPGDTGGRQEVVVTGSRIARSDLTAEQPVAVQSGQYIRDRGFTNLADAGNQLPASPLLPREIRTTSAPAVTTSTSSTSARSVR